MADRLGELITQPGVDGFAELNETDHAVDVLHAALLAAITSASWRHGVRASNGRVS